MSGDGSRAATSIPIDARCGARNPTFRTDVRGPAARGGGGSRGRPHHRHHRHHRRRRNRPSRCVPPEDPPPSTPGRRADHGAVLSFYRSRMPSPSRFIAFASPLSSAECPSVLATRESREGESGTLPFISRPWPSKRPRTPRNRQSDVHEAVLALLRLLTLATAPPSVTK